MGCRWSSVRLFSRNAHGVPKVRHSYLKSTPFSTPCLFHSLVKILKNNNKTASVRSIHHGGNTKRPILSEASVFGA